MPRYLLPLLIAVAVAIALALTGWTLGRAGATEAANVEQDVGPFHRLEVNGGAEVVLQRGRVGHVSVETSVRGQRVRADVRDGTLRVTARDTRRWWNGLVGGSRSRAVRVTITYSELDALALSGSVKLTASGLDTPELRLDASGGSTVRIDDIKTQLLRVNGDGALKAELSGHATEQRVSISGAGDYNAEHLESDQASVDVSGVGNVVLRVAKTLSASISGAGTIEYYGDPQVRQRISGVGRIKRREAAIADPHGLRLAGWPLLGLPGACQALI